MIPLFVDLRHLPLDRSAELPPWLVPTSSSASALLSLSTGLQGATSISLALESLVKAICIGSGF